GDGAGLRFHFRWQRASGKAGRRGERHADRHRTVGSDIDGVNQAQLVNVNGDFRVVTGAEGVHDPLLQLLNAGGFFDLRFKLGAGEHRGRGHFGSFGFLFGAHGDSVQPWANLTAKLWITWTIEAKPTRRPMTRLLSRPRRRKKPSTSNATTSRALWPEKSLCK